MAANLNIVQQIGTSEADAQMAIPRVRSRHYSADTGTSDRGIPVGSPLSGGQLPQAHATTNTHVHAHIPGNMIVCYITQADNRVFHVEVDHKADGEECLDKICKILGIGDESEYFGLQYHGPRNELLWLNTRNRLSKQLPGSQPFHLYFRVKFYAPPHTLLLEETKHQFYTNVAQQLRLGLWQAESPLDFRSQLIALMAQAEFGNFNMITTPCKYACFWPDSREHEEIPPEVIRLASEYQRGLQDAEHSHVEYELIRMAALELSLYGTMFYEVKDIFENRLLIGVGPEGLFLCSTMGKVIEKYAFSRVQRVTVSTRVITLMLFDDEGATKAYNYQLHSHKLANSLYRCVTEVHSFFRCDTVRDDVVGQTNRDLKETFVSLFDHHSLAGREFVFDVRRTCREVYDRARRRLHTCSSNVSPPASPLDKQGGFTFPTSNSAGAVGSLTDNLPGKGGVLASSRADSVASEEEVHDLRQQLERLRDASLCRVCMDQPINRVFFPCGHSLCCGQCAERLDQCPICRQTISLRHPLYLPWTLESGVAHHITSEIVEEETIQVESVTGQLPRVPSSIELSGMEN